MKPRRCQKIRRRLAIDGWMTGSRRRRNASRRPAELMTLSTRAYLTSTFGLIAWKFRRRLVIQHWRSGRPSAVTLCSRRKSLPIALQPVATTSPASIVCCLDYCNSSPDELLRRLQSFQHAAARLVDAPRRFDHITPIRCQLHCSYRFNVAFVSRSSSRHWLVSAGVPWERILLTNRL